MLDCIKETNGKKDGKTMDKLFITNDTVSTIIVQPDGSWILTIYFEKQVLHEKQYKTFAAAKTQETKLLKRYRLSCY